MVGPPETDRPTHAKQPVIFAARGAPVLEATTPGRRRHRGRSAPEVGFPITGWWMDGAFTKRSVQLD